MPQDITYAITALENGIDARRQEQHIPGCALVVVKDDTVVLLKGFGLRNVEQQLPMTPDTLTYIASCTKSFTALAAVMSQDRGQLSLEHSPKVYLPSFRLYDPEADAQVTLRDMLCHRTGLGLGAGDFAGFSTATTRTDLIHLASLIKPTARLRERFQYNNLMYIAAGEAIARANAMTFEEVIQQHIFDPLNMRASTLSPAALQHGPNRALSYALASDGNKTIGIAGRAPIAPLERVAKGAPAGSIVTTARDMGQWLRLMLNGGVVEGARLVSQEGFAELSKPHIPAWGGYYGLGWRVDDWHGQPILRHDGGGLGYAANVVLLPEQQLGFAIMLNVVYAPLRDETEKLIFDAFLGEVQPKTPDPIILQEPVLPAPVTPQTFIPPLSIEELMHKTLDAIGGKEVLHSLRSTVVRFTYDMEQMGITGEGTQSRQSPNKFSEQMTLWALGKKLGQLHIACNGITAGRRATDGLDQNAFSEGPDSGTTLDNARNAAAFFPLLNWKECFKRIHVLRVEKVGEEDAYVVEKIPLHGDPITDYISTSTFLLLKRNDPWLSPGGSRTYDDYRWINGIRVPYRWTEHQPYPGTINFQVLDIQFNIPIAETTFQLQWT